MERIEVDLRELMMEQAATATEVPPPRQTLRRARGRQLVTLAATACAAVVVAAGVVASAGALRDGAPDVAAPTDGAEGAFDFSSTPGEPPVVARGEFRGASWELVATPAGDAIGSVTLELVVERGDETARDDVMVMPTDTAVAAWGVLETDLLDGASAVFGAVMPEVETVDVEIADDRGTTLAAGRFAGTRRLGDTDYFLAFVPARSSGIVRARDAAGIDVGVSAYGDVEIAREIVAGGEVGDRPWRIAFVADGKTRACVAFTAGAETRRECLTSGDLADAGPMLTTTHETSSALGVVAIISDEVGYVRLVTDDGLKHDLPWFQPPNEDRAEWPVRLVAVGLEPGTTGRLEAFDGQGELLHVEPFLGERAP